MSDEEAQVQPRTRSRPRGSAMGRVESQRPPKPSRTVARSATSAARPARSSTAPSASGSCSSASRFPPSTTTRSTRNLDELALLVDTAGADEVGRVVQRRPAPDPPPTSARARRRRSRDLAVAIDCDTVVFDDELTPGPAVQPREAARAHGDRPHRGDPRHLRPERLAARRARRRSSWRSCATGCPRLRGKGGSMSQQGRGGIGYPHRTGPARRSSRSTAGASCAASTSSRPTLRPDRPGTATRSARPRRRSALRHVVIVGYTNAGKSTLLNRLTDAGVLVEDRLFATLDADHPAAAAAGRRVGAADRHRRVRPQAAPPAGRGVQVDARRGDRRRPAGARRRRLGARPRGGRSRPCATCSSRSAPDRCPSCWCSTRPTGSRRGRAAGRRVPGLGRDLGRHRRGHRRAARAIGDRLAVAGRRRSSCSIPYDRGDVIAAVHRAGEVLSETAERRRRCGCGPGSRPAESARFAEFVRARADG